MSKPYLQKNSAGHKIMVIEDDPGIVEIIKIILESKGYLVDTYSPGLDVLETIRKSSPKLILLDLWMSGQDGQEIIKLLHQDNLLKDIPVIVISALTEGKEIALKAGADNFLAKPFDIDDLLEVVNKHL